MDFSQGDVERSLEAGGEDGEQRSLGDGREDETEDEMQLELHHGVYAPTNNVDR